jgi:superfamily II DNA or RNA helicase
MRNIKPITSVRTWQKSAYEKLVGKRFAMLRAVTGSGKSTTVAMLAHNYWAQNKTQNKIIVAVPNKAIGNNFARILIQDTAKGVNVKFVPLPENVLTSADAESKTDCLLSFMDTSADNFCSSIVVCCHATFLRAVEKHPNKFKNCLVVADEFHHSRNDEGAANKLGKITEILCQESTNSILMVTATPFRSDNGSLFAESIRGQIVSYDYNLSQYLSDCTYLQKVNYESHFYDHASSYGPALEEYFKKNGIGCTIVFLPHVRLYNRRIEVCTVLASVLQVPLRGEDGEIQMLLDLQNPQSGPFRRTNAHDLYWEYENLETGRKLRVVDLDDDCEIRERRLEWLANNKDVEEDTDYLLISLQVFIEGGDFPALSKVINLSIDKSFLRMIQKWGRATRDYPGKETATFVQFMNINDGYNMDAAETYNENQLDEMIGLMEVDMDVLEMQAIANSRGYLIESSSKPVISYSLSDQDVGVVPSSDYDTKSMPITYFLRKTWKSLVAACLLGAALGSMVQYGTKEYAKKESNDKPVVHEAK